MQRSLVWTIIALLGACDHQPLDHADPGPETDEVTLETRQLAVSCDPQVLAYPILGPHNGGWDNNVLDFTCPPHPGASPDNSDWIAGDHYGNDLFAEKGELAVAPVNGVVVKSGWNDVGGWRVTLEDACGWWYYSAHLDTIDPAAQLGAAFTAGQIIGTVGNSGSAQTTAPHIHFSIYPAGSYNSGVNPFPYLEAADDHSCEETTTPPTPPTNSKCPSGASTSLCDGNTMLLTCTNGVVTNEQNCGSMGGYCSELMGPGATCVSTQCTPSANVAPVPGTSLCVAGVRHVCGADGWPQPAPCDAGLACVGAGQCEGTPRDPQCPPSGKATHCDSSTTYVSCSDGLKTGSGDCAIFEGICLEPITGEAACAEARCAEPMSLAFTEHMICVEGVRHRCDVTGWSTPMPCADGASCTGAGECASQCVPYAERCNGADDDCDGIIDESQPVILGGPCPSNTPGCEVLGQWACGPTEVPVCVTAPGLCPPETHADAQAGRPLADTVGGAFEPAGGETAEAEPTPVTSTCSGGPSPCVPLTLCVLAWRAWWIRGRRPFSRAAARDAILG